MHQSREHINGTITKEAWELLSEITGTGQPLHQLACSPSLNAILKDPTSSKHPTAKALLAFIMQNSNLLSQEELTGRTAFSQAVLTDHRETVQEMLSIMKKTRSKSFLMQLLMHADQEGNTVLHHAVNAMNHTLIQEISEIDNERKIFFALNHEGLFSIALAFKNYTENRATLPLSIINQLYFSLEYHQDQTLAAEMEVRIAPWILKYPLWCHVLRICAMRDSENEIKNIDLNLWDFIIKVVENGLVVLNLNVSKELIYDHSKSYSETPGRMLEKADETRLVYLAARTLNQAGTNNTLARNKKFMEMAQLGEANYALWFATTSNSACFAELLKESCPHLPLKEIIALAGERLFYIQTQGKSNATRSFQEIEYATLSDTQKKRFEDLKILMVDIIQPGKYLAIAPDTAAVNIMPLVPLMKIETQNRKEEQAEAGNTSILRSIGMTFLRGKITRPDISALNIQEYGPK